jgi:plastocyanin
MVRRAAPSLCAVLIAVLLIARDGSSAGGGMIRGTVTVTGATSSADAVVFVQQAPGRFQPPTEPADMDQRKKEFVPHVLPIVAGARVRFLNSDPTHHNVFSPDHEKYNLGTWRQGQTKAYTFDKCTTFPCAYTQLCLLHAEMQAFIVVLQNPYFAVTDQKGGYEIANVPPGSYQLAVWRMKGKTLPKPVTVNASATVTVDFTLGK